ncbi:DNA/RNA non-specific endonuclease [Micromonospora sp. WMMD712]|uniref:DNA/RNA non-specific endonuclease n=1 Tax=Micromonospora sp. WMMD712 TaxID=3016096 RepID=UPI00249C05C0|nr:DNA/RNA non-specific endonuclease [Micromonospora sp. WMMD712]WFE56376.1 DNA/RNA non-specific endonuclease [Micromonospora sp. WMMD712]
MELRTRQAGRQQDAVAARVAGRTPARGERIEILRRPGGLARADEPERVATRIDRLSRYHPDVCPINPAAIRAGDTDAVTAAGVTLERIIQSDDLLGVAYLEGGVVAARAVGRVNIRDGRGRLTGYGTGSMVTAELLLTNHHVLPDEDVAAQSGIEFDYQDGPDGTPLPLRAFALDPGRFFLADAELDFALVAVAGAPAELGPFGFNRLIESEGKAIVGDFVSIVQHPCGGKKQVALRENRVVDVVDSFLHYETDTQPGSSGSPVFNDQWEVVALHHASTPAPGHDELGGIVNEGLRVSRLLAFLRRQSLPPARQLLLDGLFATGSTLPSTGPAEQLPGPAGLARPGPVAPFDGHAPRRPVAPFDGHAARRPVGPAAGGPTGLVAGPPAAREAAGVDPGYTDRAGYDPLFLGGGHPVPLPALAAGQVPLAAVNRQATAGPRYVLPYHHFSVVLHRLRRLAFFTAVNIDGNTSVRLRREPDRWTLDPRVAADEQTGEEVYAANPLDRGHLVRRLDPAWGASRAVAKAANDDTFHFTNCSPQHEDFNQNKTTWAGLEDYLLENADNLDLRVSVFTGPVLADDDDPYRGVQLPRQFWKVAAMVRADGALSATAYLLSQADLIAGLELVPAAFSYGAYRTYQVPVNRVEALTRLSFGALRDADPLARLEGTGVREIDDPRQIVL